MSAGCSGGNGGDDGARQGARRKNHRYTLEEIENLWLHVLACSEVGEEWRCPPGWEEGMECKKGRGLIIDDDGLGITLRLLLIHDYLGISKKEIFDLAKKKSSSKKDKRSNLEKITQIGSDFGFKNRDFFFQDGILCLVNERRARDGIDGFPDENILFNSKFTGDDAFKKFRTFLRERYSADCGDGQGDWVGAEQETPVAMGVPENVGRFSSRSDNGGVPPVLINIHAGDGHGWAELSSHAERLLSHHREKSDGRDVHLISLRRPIMPHRTAVAAGGARVPNPGWILSQPQLIQLLHDICYPKEKTGAQLRLIKYKLSSGFQGEHSPFDVPDAYYHPPRAAVNDLLQLISEIRISLVIKPRIIILDGYFKDEDGGGRPLRRHIADDDVEELLIKLLEPPICEMSDPELGLGWCPDTMGRFLRNCFIVMSNRQLDRLVRHYPQYIPGKSEPSKYIWCDSRPLSAVYSGPFPSLEEFFRRGAGLFHPGRTSSFIKMDAIRTRHGNLGYLLDACVGIIAALDHSDGLFVQLERLLARLPPDSQSLDDAILDWLLTRLKEERPVWFDILALVAMPPDGVRATTIRRFARRAALMSDALAPFPALRRAEDEGTLQDEIEELLEGARPMIGRYRDDSLDEVDKTGHPFEYGLRTAVYDVERVDCRGKVVLDAQSIDYLFPEFKTTVLNIAFPFRERKRYHAAHRILSEDAMIQQTISLRHVDGTSVAHSIRPWRRMLSALYHGLQSLPVKVTSERCDDVVIENVDFGSGVAVSVGKAPEFWLHLYAFYYRRMIERPPAWNLTRFYGIDDLKPDLLQCFDQPWMLWPKSLNTRATARWGDVSLFQGNSARARTNELEKDHRFGMVQANSAIGLLNCAEGILGRSGDGSTDEQKLSRLKRFMDIRILRGKGFADLDVCAALERGLNDGKPIIDDFLTKSTKLFMDRTLVGDLSMSEGKYPAKLSEVLDSVTMINLGMSSENIADICDIYCRFGEFHATRADLARAHLYRAAGGVSADGVDANTSLEILSDFPFDEKNAVTEEFCRSLAYFRFAEELRLRNFSLNPLGGKFFASGHAVRLSIRVAMKLERLTRDVILARGERIDRFGPFACYARRMADTFTRHLFRYPRERASQLIIEASMLRLLSFDDDKQDNLTAARKFLAKAETLVIPLGHMARIHMRLSLERAKLNRDLAVLEYASGGRSMAKMYLQYCEYDVGVLEKFSDRFGLPIWEELARIQKDRLENAKLAILGA